MDVQRTHIYVVIGNTEDREKTLMKYLFSFWQWTIVAKLAKDKKTTVEQKCKEINSDNITHESMWNLYFDGSMVLVSY